MKFSNSDSSLLRRFKRKLHWQAHLLLPNFIPALCEHDAVDFDEIDRKHNEFSRVPEGECLRAAVIWGMELYGPREVDNLYERLDRLNWTAGFGRPAEEGAHHWIRQQRNYGAAGAWYNVGHVSDEGRAKRFIGVGNHAVIPNGVDYLLVRIFQLTPSLTCLLIGFVLKEELARVYECELLRDRTSQRERRRGATSVFILNPENLKSRALRKARGDLRFVAYNWFREHLPGFFSKLPSDRLPTAELVSTQFTNLLDAENIPRDWRRLFGYPSKFDVWTHQAHPGLHFAAESAPWIEDSNHLLVNLCTSQVPDEILRIWGERSARAYANFGHEALDGILVNHAAIAFLKEVSKDLKISRSEFAMHGAGRRNPSSALDKIQAFFDRSLGTPAVAAELLERAKQTIYYQTECAGFSSPNWDSKSADRSLAKFLQGRTRFLAASVVDEERALRDYSEQLSGVLAVRESLRAQRRMEWLTVVAVVVATCSLFVAIAADNDRFQTVLRVFG